MTSPTPDFGSASALLKSTLESWGLPTLYGDVDDMLRSGDGPDVVVMKLRATPQYKKRFAANEARLKQGKTPLTEAEYISTERSYEQILRSYGLPQGFYDDYSDYASFMEKDVSPAELRDRVSLLSEGYLSAPQEYKDQFARAGFTPGDVLASALDADRALPLLRQRFTSLGIAGEAARAYGQNEALSLDQAQKYAEQGVSTQDARKAFGDLAGREERDLFLARIGGFDQSSQALRDEALLGQSNTAREQALAQERARFQGNTAGQQGSLSRQSGGTY